jgi:hypothetical protein
VRGRGIVSTRVKSNGQPPQGNLPMICIVVQFWKVNLKVPSVKKHVIRPLITRASSGLMGIFGDMGSFDDISTRSFMNLVKLRRF